LVSQFLPFSNFSILEIRPTFIVLFFDCSIQQTPYLPEIGISFYTKAALKAYTSKNHKPLNMQIHFDKKFKISKIVEPENRPEP